MRILHLFPLIKTNAYRLLESRDGRQAKTCDDGHQRIEIAHVEALFRYVDEVLDDAHTVAFLRVTAHLGSDQVRYVIKPIHVVRDVATPAGRLVSGLH